MRPSPSKAVAYLSEIDRVLESEGFETKFSEPRPQSDLNSKLSEQRIGDYEIICEIARGGMGVVFKARQAKLNRIVALKMIKGATFASQEEIIRFQTEAEAAARLDHPGIVPVYEVGQHDGQPFFSMAFVQGKSLLEVLRDNPMLPKEAAEMLVDVAEAISHAHSRGVIHRDLKPGNIIFDEDDHPKVTGLGTPSFMPPDPNVTNPATCRFQP